MKETRIVRFRVKSSKKDGHETDETLLKKFEDYKLLLEKEYKIIDEKEVVSRRGEFIEISYI